MPGCAACRDSSDAKLIETDNRLTLTQRPPTASQVEDWVAQAKALPKLLTY